MLSEKTYVREMFNTLLSITFRKRITLRLAAAQYIEAFIPVRQDFFAMFEATRLVRNEREGREVELKLSCGYSAEGEYE